MHSQRLEEKFGRSLQMALTNRNNSLDPDRCRTCFGVRSSREMFATLCCNRWMCVDCVRYLSNQQMEISMVRN